VSLNWGDAILEADLEATTPHRHPARGGLTDKVSGRRVIIDLDRDVMRAVGGGVAARISDQAS
jgi:hypothetical protein